MHEHTRDADDALAPLSPAGIARRRRMLESLKQRVPTVAAARRRRTRSLRAAMAVALLAGGAWIVAQGVSRQLQSGRVAGPVAGASGVTIEITTTRSDVDAVSIDDEELLATLASIGRPTGLARMGDRVVLTAPVTDAALAPSAEPAPSRDDAAPAGADAL